jgi:hypothetical protein
MPRTRFYNRRFASRAPATNTTSGDSPPSAVGNPPAFDFETDRGDAAFTPSSSEEGAGPPCGHPASSSSALDGASLASGRSAVRPRACALGTGAIERRSFIGCWRLRRIGPSDTSLHDRAGTRERPRSLPPELLFQPGTSMHRPSRSSRCLPPGKTRRRLFRAPSSALPPLAGGAAAARFHRCSKNLD